MSFSQEAAAAAGGSRSSMEATHNNKLRSEEDGASMDKAINTTAEHEHVEGGVTATERAHLKQGLEQRHLSMIALAGSIGTGLFLSLGGSIQTGGPLGALLGYAVVGAIVCAVQFALGEVSALLPVTGSFIRHADYLIDPAWGFAVGWNLVYGNLLSIPSEISAICVLFQFWTDINSSLWIMVFILLTFAVGVAFVRAYGEVEFFFASLKLLTIVFLIIFGLVVNLGGIPGVERIGFRYWDKPGPFVEYIGTGAWGRFLGFWSCMINATFSFSGVESLAMAAAETRNPGRTIPRACKRVFLRIVLFYLLAVLVVGMLVASDDPRLNDESGTASQSPFVIAVSTAGYSAVGSAVNAIVISSAWSSSNQAFLSGTRVLYGLAIKRQAPRFFLKTTSWGIPIYCTLFFTAFMFLAFMSLSSGALTVFYWFVSLTAAGVLVSWSTVLFNHIRLKTALRRQGIPASELPWNNGWTLYSSYVALVMCIVILFTGGFSVFTSGRWDANSFVSSYLDIPLVIVFFLGWKLIKKTKWVKLEDLPLREAIEQARELAVLAERQQEAEDAVKGKRTWLRFISWIWD
ncbi:probable general amino acid permease [Sporisorium scitamineum]|uniref:Probable general amino acid permease n=1 Tax=Sporisorium scitamineum TaxID=49012 RepID=A0A0F7RWP7_9BASI|nr:hypothetical protein [Sporisorium scitamineum]CDU25368.1 probable general amino acid permease [Sporisorium scitamineum]